MTQPRRDVPCTDCHRSDWAKLRRGLCDNCYQRDLRRRRAALRPTREDKFFTSIRWPGAFVACWRWMGSINRDGYGWFGRISAHRFAYELFVGSIPAGLEVDHLCRVRDCVNPLHLEPVAKTENILRGISPAALNARKTACKRGHPFTPENTYHRSYGRACKACQFDRNARRARRP